VGPGRVCFSNFGLCRPMFHANNSKSRVGLFGHQIRDLSYKEILFKVHSVLPIGKFLDLCLGDTGFEFVSGIGYCD
jgi:hypothetical protein